MNRYKILYFKRGCLLFILVVIAILFIKLNNLIVDSQMVLPEAALREYPSVYVSDKDDIPPYSDNLISLFPKKIVSVINKPAPEPAPVEKVKADVDIPGLKFVGMIETDKKIVYSFRNTGKNRMLLIEEGGTSDGITLLSVESMEEGRIFMFEIGNTPFEVVTK